jgi:ABC-type polysaccharide transport system permease subunit
MSQSHVAQPLKQKRTQGQSKHGTRENRAMLFMTIPGVLVLLAFSYLPMAGVLIAFKNYRAADGIFNSAWVGLKNFDFLFSSGTAWRITWNTLFLNSAFTKRSQTTQPLVDRFLSIGFVFSILYFVCDCWLLYVRGTKHRKWFSQ